MRDASRRHQRFYVTFAWSAVRDYRDDGEERERDGRGLSEEGFIHWFERQWIERSELGWGVYIEWHGRTRHVIIGQRYGSLVKKDLQQ
jgi:hypothetical protein